MTQEREEGRTITKFFVGVYADAKTAFDDLAAKGIGMPRTVMDLVLQLQEGGALRTLARELYTARTGRHLVKDSASDGVRRENGAEGQSEDR